MTDAEVFKNDFFVFGIFISLNDLLTKQQEENKLGSRLY
jgi:hypothetical protein